MFKANRRINREKKTIKAMIRIYCRNHHKTDEEICPECNDLLRYAIKRLDKCPFLEYKTTCAKCAIHCYNKVKREKVISIMRFSGPRMIKRHPMLAILHLLDGKKRRVGSNTVGDRKSKE